MARDFDLSAKITADASGLVQAGAQAEAAYEGVGKAAKNAATGTAALEAETEKVADAEAKVATGAAAMADAIVKAAARGAAAQRESNKAAADAAAAANRQGYALRNLGQQFGDFATQVSLGSGVARAFASQAGQVGYALSEMGGRLGKVGTFLVGPWGIALTVATTLLAPFVEKLFEGGKAADELLDKTAKAATAADSYGNAQSFLGKAIDLTTGKLKTQNATLVETIALQARAGILKAQQDQRDARDALKSVGDPGFLRGAARAGGTIQGAGFVSAIGGALNSASNGAASGNDPRLAGIARQFSLGKLTQAQAQARIDRLGLGEARAVEEGLKLAALATAREDEKANREALTAIRGGGLSAGLRQTGRVKRPAKTKSTAALNEFGSDAADRLANLRDQFDQTPQTIRQVNAQIRQLDDLIDDLARKKPPGFEKLIADAKALKPLVLDSLNKPYADFIKAQQDSLAVGALTLQGRTDEAAALRTVQQLQATMGPLTLEQKDAVLATTQAITAQARALQVVQQENAKYVEGVASVKAIVQDATQNLSSLVTAPKRLFDAFKTFQGRKLFDNLFGDVFRDLEDQANGTKVVKDASDRMATAVDKASASIAKLGEASEQAAGSVGGATAVPAGGGAVSDIASKFGLTRDANGRITSDLLSATGLLGGGLGAALGKAGGVAGSGTTTDSNGDIIVNGRKNPVVASIGKLGEKIGGLFGVKDPAAFGSFIGKNAGKALGGAATGALANSVLAPLGKALGFKTSQTGAQIGGAIGSFIPIPGGDIIGSIAGSLIGGLFKKTKSGSASISNVGGEAVISGTSGNSSAYKKAASGLAGTVIDGINSVADALGGSLGSFSVSIGQRKKKFVVDTSGNGRTKGSGTQSFDTAEEAAAAAIANAIADGAVKGISAAMQRALQSSTDVDKAVKEALKVKEVETLIGGLGSTLKAQFDAFDATAADRVNIARKYGLDVLAVEKINADQRAKLVEDTLKSRIGSLSDFLDQLKFGDLSEGTATDRRTALLDKIKGVQADAEAGKDGAADQLAQLYAQLVQNSRDAFGTAGGEYSSDRTSAQSGVERVIAMERERITQASNGGAATVAAINEGNDIAAQTLASINSLPSSIAALIYGGGSAGSFDFKLTGREVALT